MLIYSMIIRSVLSDQQKPIVIVELKKIICDYLNKIKYMQTVNNKVWHHFIECRNLTRLLPVSCMTDKYASYYTY